VLYTVEDDGPGVAAGEEERIFEPGSRGDPARRNGEPGAGLGLALSRRLARAIDGDIVADVRAGRGRFLIRLPAG
jgi:signal transduction histidine kinase